MQEQAMLVMVEINSEFIPKTPLIFYITKNTELIY